jgi:hypothetical protein
MNDRLIRQRGFFFGMILVLAMLALILAWLFIQSILLALALVVILKPMYNWFLERQWIGGSARKATGRDDSGCVSSGYCHPNHSDRRRGDLAGCHVV